ncbi:hypothetical protein MVEN_02291200 [Mycena venus]|uniref:Uncharacterized protein n=1 Tax=Mycena venus TaxID=2733690 RepID=A0A8H6X5N6_9AGAR|nr:hypothetical protein MVEN_02291200 [Mycena venus]
MSSNTVSGSHIFPLAVQRRDTNATTETASPSFANFTFPIPAYADGDDFANWVSVVCIRPDLMTIDDCRNPRFGNWERCPNPDVSGILVRVGAYLANLLLGIVAMYDPEKASEAVWAQLLTVYSLLISAIIALYTKGLSRFHSGMTVFLVLSPLSVTLAVYAVFGFFGRPHRLDSVLSSRRKHLLPRVLVVGSWLISMALLIFTSMANDSHFTVVSPCDTLIDKGGGVAVFYSFNFVPYIGVGIAISTIFQVFGPDAAHAHDGIAINWIIGTCAPAILLVVSFACAVLKSRSSLAAQVQMQSHTKGAKLWAYWALFGKRYPFLHFCGVFLVPMLYWILVNELRLAATPDNLFVPSFGQVLAVFVVLPPLLQALQMIPRAWLWFKNLTVVRLFTRRPPDSTPVNLEEENQELASLGGYHKLDT